MGALWLRTERILRFRPSTVRFFRSLCFDRTWGRWGELTVEGAVSVEGASRRRARMRYVAAVIALAALAVGGVGLDVGGLGGSYDRISRDLGMPWVDGTRDTDGDGLSDDVEREGWRTRDDGVFVTDPKIPDSDGDGLTDGQEAGPLASGTHSTKVYVGLSRPLELDTDGDEVGDGDEYFLDMNPRRRDTDDDGLLDNLELDFGSDPTHGNVDDDSYSDKEEYERGSDPVAYDLDRGEAVAAFLAGATAGDWEAGARRIGLRDAQIQSPEYLAGQIASGVIGIGDLRDIAAAVGTGDLVGAAVSAVALTPIAGDATKTGVTLTKFAKRGDRAERAADDLLERLPWSMSTKERVRRKMFGSAVKLPKSLEGGPKENSVYKGVGYVGITKDFPRRKYEHATAGRMFTPALIAGASGLSRGQARAIEEACIVELGLKADGGTLENQQHSIDPRLPYHAEAITWAQKFLRERGGTCV